MLGQKSIVKSMFLFFALILVIISGSSLILYRKFNRVIYEQIVNDQRNSLRNNKFIFETFIEDINDTLFDIRMNKLIAEYLVSDVNDSLAIINHRQAIRDELILIENKFLENCYVTLFVDQQLPFAKNLLAYNSDLFTEEKVLRGAFPNNNVHSAPWYQDALINKDRIQSFYSADTDNIYFITAMKNPFLKPSTYDFTINTDMYTMLAVIRLSRSSMIKMAKSLHLIKGSTIQIFNENQQLLYTYPEDAKIERETFITVEENFSNGWSVTAYIPHSYIIEQTAFVKKYVSLVTLLLILINLSFAFWMIRHITGPILELSKTMKATNFPKQKNYENRDIYSKNNEIGILFNSYDRMMEQLVLSIENQKQSEYKALQAQINPHFIYNTLDSINWIALCNDQDHIAKMTTTLSNILKYSIKEPNTLITVKEEVEYIEEYIYIENIRYNDVLHFQYHIHPKLESYKVPKFIFQPLVENAVKHGIMKNGGGTIYMESVMEEDNILFYISDNGPGYNVDELNNYLEGFQNIQPESSGIGIKNVNERIHNRYGYMYGLYYMMNNPTGLKVQVKLPRL